MWLHIFSGFGETNCGHMQNFTDQQHEWLLTLHHQQKIYPLAAVLLKPQPVRRSPWQVLACYDQRTAAFKNLPLHPYVRRSPWQVHDSTSVVLSVFTWSYFDCSSMLPVFCSWWDMTTFHKKECKIDYFFCPSSDQQNPREKIDRSRRMSNRDHRKRRSARQSPRNSACPFSSVVHYTPVAQEKHLYPRIAIVYSYLLHYCCTTVLFVL